MVILLLAATLDLHTAVYNNDTAQVRQILAGKADVNAPNRHGVTPLYLACEAGSGDLVPLLLTAGADPNLALRGGETPLMACSRTGNIEAVRALLARKAQVNAKESLRSQTALMWAAAEGHVEVVQLLLAAGAESQHRLPSGFNAFLLAVREGQRGVVELMLKAGADINDTVQPAPRPTANVRGAPRAGTSALHLAVGNAHFELAAFLLDHGAKPDVTGPGYAPLHMIAHLRKPGGGDNDPAPRGSGTMTSLQIVERFARAGADLNIRMTRRTNFGLTALETTGATPFFLAARTGDAELMRLLAKLGADPLVPNINGSTPLMAAAGLGTRSPGEDAGTEEEAIEAAALAIELGNDVNAVDKNGETAVHSAAYKNLPGMVHFLVKKGARVDVWNRPNKQGWTPLTIAQGYRFGNYKPSPVTVAAIEKELLAVGVTPTRYTPPAELSNNEYRKPATR